jgi:hypothetical protein
VVELVTIAVKYSKPTLQSPIVVGVSPDEKELRVVVSDGGSGLPTEFDLQTSKGLGMQVVLLLVRQLHATHPRGRSGLGRHPLHPHRAIGGRQADETQRPASDRSGCLIKIASPAPRPKA